MEEVDPRIDLVSRYANVENKITGAILRYSADPFFRSSLEDLQKTVRSMEPMVEDMELSEIESSRHTFMINKFLPLLIQVEARIRQFLGIERPATLSKVGTLTASICLWLGIELSASSMAAITFKKDMEIIQGRFKDLYADYVNEELDKLALSNPAVADEVVTEGLLRYLLSKIRNEAFRPLKQDFAVVGSSSQANQQLVVPLICLGNPVFEKIKIILESIETGFYSSRQQQSSESSTAGADNFSQPPIDMPRLLRLLNEVKLLLRFLNGDHGLDILNCLQQREYALRGFVTDVVNSWLDEMDWRHANLQRLKMIIMTFLLLGVLVYTFANAFDNNVFDNSEYPNSPSEFADLIFTAIFILLLAYYLAMQISTHFRLGQFHAQRQSSNSNNSLSKLEDLFPPLENTSANVDWILCLFPESIRKYQPITAEFVGESSKENEEGAIKASVSTSLNKMSSVTRPKAGFDVKDIMSGIRAKVGVKTDGGKPHIPKGDSSTSKVGTEKKRKFEDVEIVRIVEKDEWRVETARTIMEGLSKKSMDLVDYLLKEVEMRGDKIKILDQKAKAEAVRATQAASETIKVKKDLENLTIRMLEVEEEHIKELDATKERFMLDASKSVMESRIEMMKEFDMGQHVNWRIEDEVVMLNAFLGEVIDAGEVNSKVQEVKVTYQSEAKDEKEDGKKEGEAASVPASGV